jgi:prolyl 4-hydroxylase
VAYKPKPGDALFFFDMKPDYRTTDGFSTHTGCPVIDGVKWNAVKWIHGKPFREDEYKSYLTTPYVHPPDPGHCVDLHDQCNQWAEAGECEKNKGYMLGADSTSLGACLNACKACEVCGESDKKCYDRNRANAGFLNFNPEEMKHLV